MKARGLALARQLLSSREIDALESGKDIVVPSPIHPGVVYRIRKWATLRRYAAGRYEASYCVHPAVQVPAIEEATIFAIFIRAGQEGKLLSAANRYVRAGGDT